jgi:hypothetical protein
MAWLSDGAGVLILTKVEKNYIIYRLHRGGI